MTYGISFYMMLAGVVLVLLSAFGVNLALDFFKLGVALSFASMLVPHDHHVH